MKFSFASIVLVAVSLLLAGCASSGLLNRSRGPVAEAPPVQSRSNLALPPDLQLPAPGSGRVASYQAATPDDGVYGTPSATPAPRRRIGGVTCTNGTQAADNYECYGISKLKPDGTKKNPTELNMELRAALLAEKRRSNPGYGTIRNWRSIWN